MLNESRPNSRHDHDKPRSDEIATRAGGAGCAQSWREGVAGTTPREMGSGLSGQGVHTTDVHRARHALPHLLLCRAGGGKRGLFTGGSEPAPAKGLGGCPAPPRTERRWPVQRPGPMCRASPRRRNCAGSARSASRRPLPQRRSRFRSTHPACRCGREVCFPTVPAGEYSISVGKPGFQTLEQLIVVRSGTVTSLTLPLPVGAPAFSSSSSPRVSPPLSLSAWPGVPKSSRPCRPCS